MSDLKVGSVVVVENKNKHRLAKSTYNYVRLQLSGVDEVPALFTNKELKAAILRAKKNTEDIIQVYPPDLSDIME